jgi:hypothetical protein
MRERVLHREQVLHRDLDRILDRRRDSNPRLLEPAGGAT